MLKFIGTKGAFSIGNNNSAYYINGDKLILFDCGETVFKEILRKNIIGDNIKCLDIIITHFHSDHVGSLGSLVFYCRYKKIKIKIIYPDIEKVHILLNILGIDKKFYQAVIPSLVDDYYLKEYEQYHGDVIDDKIVRIDSYGYHFINNRDNIFFSGDTSVMNRQVLDKFKNKEINILYQDVAVDGYKAHVQLETLETLIDSHNRNRVVLMHLSDDINTNYLKELGFNIAEEI